MTAPTQLVHRVDVALVPLPVDRDCAALGRGAEDREDRTVSLVVHEVLPGGSDLARSRLPGFRLEAGLRRQWRRRGRLPPAMVVSCRAVGRPPGRGSTDTGFGHPSRIWITIVAGRVRGCSPGSRRVHQLPRRRCRAPTAERDRPRGSRAARTARRSSWVEQHGEQSACGGRSRRLRARRRRSPRPPRGRDRRTVAAEDAGEAGCRWCRELPNLTSSDLLGRVARRPARSVSVQTPSG